MNKEVKNALIIFQKNMVPGKVKTRLADKVGIQKALEIYGKLVHHTHTQCSKVDADKLLFFSDEVLSHEKPEYANYHYFIQDGADLGIRMKNAFDLGFAKGYQKVIIIGTDCAAISGGILEDAFNKLDSHDAVIGPAKDGGYYLIGIKEPLDGLFEGITWSTDQVFVLTVEKFKSKKLEYGCLPELADVDDASDWEAQKHLIE